MAGSTPFNNSPLDTAIAEEEQRTAAAVSAAGGIGLPDIKVPHVPVAQRAPAAQQGGQPGIPEIKYRTDFETAAKKYKVPVNALMALADMDKGFDHKNPAASIDGIATKYSQRKASGFNDQEAIRAFHSGDDKTKWGKDADQYAGEVLKRAGQFGQFYISKQTDPAAGEDQSLAGDVKQPTPERTWVEAFKDTALAVDQGIAYLVGAGAWAGDKIDDALGTRDPNNTLAADAFAFAQHLEKFKSQKAQDANKAVSDAKGVIATAGALLDNPASVVDTIAQSAPMAIPGLGAGAIVARQTAIAGLKKGMTELAAREAARNAAIKAGVTAEVATTAGMGGNQANEQILAVPVEQLREKSERFRTLEKTMGPEQARAQLAEEVSFAAAALQGAGTLVGGIVARKLGSKIGLGDPVGDVVVGTGKAATAKEVAKNLGGEVTEEVAQSGLEQAGQNVAMGRADNSVGVMDDVGKQALLGGVGGFGQSAAMQGGSALLNTREMPAGAAAEGVAPAAATGAQQAQQAAAAGVNPAAAPTPAQSTATGPLGRALERAAAPTEVVDQSDLGDVLNGAIATGEAGQIDATGKPVEQAAPAASDATSSAWSDWYHQNRTNLGDELFIGGQQDRRAYEQLPADVQNRSAHGMAKGGAAALVQLRELLTNGVDTSRRGGLDTAPVAGGAQTGQTASGNAYTDGAFTLVARPGVDRITDINQVDAVVVNSAVPDAVVAGLRAEFPNTTFSRAGELASLSSGKSAGASSASGMPPSTATLQEPAKEPVAREPIGGVPIKQDKVVTPAGREIGVEYRVVDASKLTTSNDDAGNVNKDYPQELQPRDRTRVASELQVNDIAKKLNPRLLGESPTTTDGAPIVSEDGVVESGNGRTLAIRRAYQQAGESAQKYREHLESMGADTAGMAEPMLVRVRTTPMDAKERADYTRESNERTTLAMGATERAKADATVIPNIIGDFKGGDLTAAANRDFVRKFVQGAVSSADRAMIANADGSLTQDGRRRIEAAILHAAYGNDTLVNDLFESSDSDIKSIGGALLDIAGDWTRMRAAADTLADGVDITDNLMEAVAVVRRARAEGRSVSDLANNGDFFAGAMDPATTDILRIFYRGDRMVQARSRAAVADALKFYAEQALGTKAGEGLFGEEIPTVTSKDLLGATHEQIAKGERQSTSQSDFFGARTQPADENAGAPGGEGQRPQPAPGSEAQAKTAAQGLTEEEAGKLKRAALKAADGDRLYTKGVAAMQAAQRTKKTGQQHEAVEVDGGWVVRQAGQESATDRRLGEDADGEPRERRTPGRTPPLNAREVWHDKMAEDVRREEADSPTYSGLPVDVRRKINDERIDARLKSEPLPIDPTSGLINGKAIVNPDGTEEGTIKGLMLEGMFNAAISHVKAGGKAYVAELDLGNLGGINHFSGQLGGDRAIAAVSKIISKTMDSLGIDGDIDLARYGGDEFFVVARSADSASARRALAAADKEVQEYMSKTTPRDLNPGLEAEILAQNIEEGEKAALLRFIDTPLSKLSKKPVKRSDGEFDFPQGKTKIHVGELVDVSAGATAEKLHAAADSSLASAKNANYKEKGNEQANDDLAGVRGDAEQGAQGAPAGEAGAGRGAPRADRSGVQADAGRAEAGGEVAAGLGEEAGVTGSEKVSLRGKAVGNVLQDEGGDLYRIDRVDTQSGLVRLVRNPDQLSERAVFKDQSGFDKLVLQDQEVKSAAARDAQRNAPPAEERFANNTLFTADKVEAARARLRSKLNGSQLNAGFDPELLSDGMVIAGAYIEAGVRDFAEFAKQMTGDFGDTIKPYLLSFWEGARYSPGLDTDGMTDTAESARLHKELMAEKPVATAAQEAIGTTVEKPKTTKKTSGTAGDKRMRQDWGVEHIDGYAETEEFTGRPTDYGVKGGVKDAFLKDAKSFVTAVASLLEAGGFEAKGRKAVNVNEAGPAVSGDVSLSMKRGDVHIYVTVGASALRGVVPGTGAGVAVMFRAGKGNDTKGTNRWVSPDLPARDLAALITQEADRAAAATEKRDEPRKLEGAGKGALAGAPADGVPKAAEQGPAGAGAAGSGRADAQGDDGARGGRAHGARGLGDGAREVPVQAAGKGGAGTRSSGSGADAGNSEGAERSAGPGVGERVSALPAQSRADDFSITDADAIGEGGAKTKFNNNLAAIRLLKELQDQGRPATRAEQAVLAKYVGWGGLPQAFYREGGGVTAGWEKQAAELKDILTADEYAAAAASTKDAHYTSPEIVAGIWKAVEQFGFRTGRVLEPSVGVGNFFGLMPKDARASSQMVGVELDAITGGIAKQLYPAANVQSPVGFQDFATPSNYFDLAVGNPPFGATKIYDGKRRELNGLSIHNYFFAKSVDALKPGGVLAMVVTNRFMDANDQKARKLITEKTELLGAIRLPNNAFLKNAGTEVTTDIIFLRKLADGETASGETWMEVKDYTDKDGNTVPLNEYFHRHPEMMLGDFGAYGTMYRAGDSALVAREGQNTGKLLNEAIARLPRDIMETSQAPAPALEVIAAGNDISAVRVGSMYLDGGKVMTRLEDELGEQRGQPVDFPNEKARERAIGMIGVRDALTDLRRLQLSNTATDKAIEGARAALNKAYDTFVAEFGPINQDGNKRVFRDDPSWPQLSALEDDFDKGVSATIAAKTGEKARKPSARKAAIFSKRTQSPYTPPTSANTAKDALVASLAETGRVDMAYMGELYGRTEEHMAKELAGLIYRNPVGGWETKDDYLSGNVKQKLAVAEMAAQQDPVYRENVEALRAVQPPDVEAVDIDVKAGAHWLPAEDMAAFANHIGGGSSAKAYYSPHNARWSIDFASSAAAAAQYGTDRVSVLEVVRAAANQKTVQVYDTLPDDTRVLNEAATQAANEKVERVKAEFKRWIWSDEDRRVRLARLYNDTFNTDRQREYDGSHLNFPGKISDDIIRLRPHQANAVWRAIQSPTTLFDHVVGAGKTFTMIGAAMEMRRMGLAKKPMFVVPNHLVGQWAADFVKLYPGANILAASKKDFDKDNRKRLFSRISTGDWDAVIVAHSSFGKVGVTPEFEGQFIKQQIADIETSLSALRAADGKDSRNVKQVEKAKAALEEKLKKLFDQDGKDNAIYFDELGVDALFLDEAHEFKNLQFSTSMQRVAGLGNPVGSQKAADMFMKVQQVMSRTGGRNIVFATGTPISNTMAEMYTMQRYLDYSAMRAQGLAHFDAWARMYGEVVTDWELSPSGQYKMNSRFAKFVNMPELMQRYGSFADVINRDDINRMLASQGKTLPVPKVKGGKPQNIVVERSSDQANYIGIARVDENGNEEYPQTSLIWRAEHLPKKAEKGADNMLKIMSDARKAALDMRLIDPSYPDNPGSKVNEAADRIVATYRKWSADRGTQLVFIDLSTPKASRGAEAARIRELIAKAEDGDQDAQDQLDKMSPDELLALESDFSVYDDLREKLIQRGIPADEIAFIHDANTDDRKEVLFGKVRSGRVRVLFGSTPKMGAGMNVQERLVALHHLDAPWRPSDLEQREGRIIRQGNVLRDRDPDGFEVEINRYATKQTLDSRMWQTIEAKARFIEQVRKGATGGREIEDVGSEASNSAEMKAASSGNPLILEEMELRQKVRKMANEATEHDREQYRIRDMIRSKKTYIESSAGRIAKLDEDAKRIPSQFVVTVGGKSFDKPKEIGVALILKAAELLKDAGKSTINVGSYGDFKLTLDKLHSGQTVLSAEGAGEYQVEIKGLDADPTGLALRLKNAIAGIPDDMAMIEARVEREQAEIPKLEEQLKPWPKAEELADAKARHAAIIDQLKPKKKEEPKKQDDGAEGKASVGGKWYYSALERAVDGLKLEKGTSQQWKAIIGKLPGVKKEEVEWLGVPEFLASKNGSISKSDVLEFVRANGVQVEEVVLGDKQYDQSKIYEIAAARGITVVDDMDGGKYFEDEDGEPIDPEDLPEDLQAAIVPRAAGADADTERLSGESKYGKYQLKGGTNYKELLLTLPSRPTPMGWALRNPETGGLVGNFDTKEKAESYRSSGPRDDVRGFEVYQTVTGKANDYRSSHWDEKNVLAHIRFNERAGANGERILHIEEVQSDWHQAGRKRGYKQKKSAKGLSLDRSSDPGFILIRDEGGNHVGGYSEAAAYGMTDQQLLDRFVSGRGGTDAVPDAPFKDTSSWSMLAMKRMIRYAAENGYDAVTWTGGEAQADRYDLSKHVSMIRAAKTHDGRYLISAHNTRGNAISGMERKAVTPEELPGLLGKDLAEKITSGTGGEVDSRTGARLYTGLDLKVGGKGMIGFYDKILPTETNALLKKMGGGKVENIAIDVHGEFDKYVGMETDTGFSHTFDTKSAAEKWAANEPNRTIRGGETQQFQGFRMTEGLVEAVNAGVPLFSRKGQATDGMSEEQATGEIRASGFGSLLDSGKVVLHQDTSDFPGKWRGKAGVQAVTMADGTIHLAAGNIRPGAIPSVMMHEAFHSDVKPLLGTETWGKLQKELAGLHRQAKQSSGKMGQFFRAAADRIAIAESVGGKMSDALKAEEFGAYAIEEYESAPTVVKGWVDRVMGAVKAWLLARFGMQAGSVTPEQLRSIAAMALKNANTISVSRQYGYTGNDNDWKAGDFDPNNPDIRASVRRPDLQLPEEKRNRFSVPEETRGEKLQRYMQDRFNRVALYQRLIGEQGGKVTEKSDVYKAEERYSGRVVARVEDFTKNEVKPFIKAVADADVTLDEVAEYAYAEHAAERNKYIQSINEKFDEGGGSGMTDEEASNIIAGYQEQGKAEKLASLAAMLRDIGNGTRNVIARDGLETPETVAAWESMFSKYVPLKGFQKVDEFGEPVKQENRVGLGGKGFSINGRETKHATGRVSKASEIIENIVSQRERAIIRAEKNKVAQSLLRLVAENPDPKLWAINEVTKKPVLLGNKPAITDIFSDQPAHEPQQEGRKVKYVSVRNRYDDNIVVVKVKGREVLVTIKDPILAEQLHMRDAKELPPFFSHMNAINRVLARLWTSLNPTFTVVNYARDIQTAALNALGETNKAVMADMLKYAAPGGWAMRATYQGMTDKDTEGAQWYERYRQAGGKTGFMIFGTLEDQKKKLDNMLRDARGDRNKAIAIGAGVIDVIETANSIIENAARLAIFRASIEHGYSESDAASLAKNLTVNFNRRGEWTHFFGALYLFFNPSIQGSTRVLHAAKRPKVQAALAGLVVGTFLLGMIGRAIGGLDDDDEYFYDKIPTSIKDRNLVFMLPRGVLSGEKITDGEKDTGGRYIKIPMPYGFSVFSSIGNAIYDVGVAKKSAVQTASDLTLAASTSFNPVDTGTPTIFTPAVQIAMNKDWFGRQVSPEQSRFETPKPDSQKYFPSAEGTPLQIATEAINDVTGGNEARPGYIDISPETIEHIVSFVTGGLGTSIKDSVNFVSQDPEERDVTRLPFIKQVVGSQFKGQALNKFYENATEADITAAEREILQTAGDKEAMAKFDKDSSWKLGFDDRASQLRKDLGGQRKAIRQIMADKSMSKAEATAAKREISAQMDAAVTAFNRDWNNAKKAHE